MNASSQPAGAAALAIPCSSTERCRPASPIRADPGVLRQGRGCRQGTCQATVAVGDARLGGDGRAARRHGHLRLHRRRSPGTTSRRWCPAGPTPMLSPQQSASGSMPGSPTSPWSRSAPMSKTASSAGPSENCCPPCASSDWTPSWPARWPDRPRTICIVQMRPVCLPGQCGHEAADGEDSATGFGMAARRH